MYPSWWFSLINSAGLQFGNISIWTQTWSRSDSP
jgi:hypothetical protein